MAIPSRRSLTNRTGAALARTRGNSTAEGALQADPLVWAARTLRETAMPSDDIRAVLAADDPEIVRRHVELHQEWLEERLHQQRRDLVRAVRILTEAILTQHVKAQKPAIIPSASESVGSCPFLLGGSVHVLRARVPAAAPEVVGNDVPCRDLGLCIIARCSSPSATSSSGRSCGSLRRVTLSSVRPRSSSSDTSSRC